MQIVEYIMITVKIKIKENWSKRDSEKQGKSHPMLE